MPGALVADGGEVTHVKAHPVIPVDASGAGDTFDGAFAARLLQGATAVEAARYAAAAITTTGHGAVHPIPLRAPSEPPPSPWRARSGLIAAAPTASPRSFPVLRTPDLRSPDRMRALIARRVLGAGRTG
ncbi:PfkB family carbohydrate kinase [Nonomuraea sp. NPDC051941]|uniref:PfkB family carbohydrate kinase n=1 Tax=Nonomuraea sp. NPDC051941 TaxID=3364373 RepID=UPI0037C7CE98